MNPEQTISPEEVLNRVSEKLDNYFRGRAAVERAVRELRQQGNKPTLLLLNSTFDRGPALIGHALQELEKRNYGSLARLYTERLFGGMPPKTIQDIYQLFFGDLYAVEQVTVGDAFSSGDIEQYVSGIDGVLMSGSSADITKALANDARPVYGDQPLTHMDVFNTATGFYQLAVERKLPVVGMCYSHQVIAHSLGGEVSRLTDDDYSIIVGNKTVTQNRLYEELLTSLEIPMVQFESGPVVHGEHVSRYNPTTSSMFMRSYYTEQGADVVQGLLHIPKGGFTGDAVKDVQLILGTLQAGEHAAITTQMHPEYATSMELISFGLDPDKTVPEVFANDRDMRVATAMMQLYSRFFDLAIQHKK